MADLPRVILRPSVSPWADFLQRVRLGLIGVLFIIVLKVVIACAS